MLPLDLLQEGCRPLKRVEFDALVELGFFADERIELLYGRLISTARPSPARAESVSTLWQLLSERLFERAAVFSRRQIARSETSEPEPDVAVVPPGSYWDRHPTTAWLAVEVADSSTSKERNVKARLYAEADVPEYWLVDLKASFVEVFRDASDGVYRSARAFRGGESLAMAHFPDVILAVDDILPPAALSPSRSG